MGNRTIGRETDLAWDRYWQDNRVSACFDSESRHLPAEFANEWSEVLGNLPTGARIVDLCTGNGVVALFAAETSANQGRRFEIHGVDRAAIDPLAFVEEESEALRTIHFHPRTDCQSLPFEAVSVDAALSQYGFEYTDIPATIEELARVMRHGGRLAFLCHATEGSVATAAREELADLELIDGRGKLLRHARDMLEWVLELERGKQPPGPKREAKFFKARKRYANSKERLERELAGRRSAGILRHMIAVFEHAFTHRAHVSRSRLLAKMAEVEESLAFHRARLRNLRDVALGEDDLVRIQGQLEAAGFDHFRTGPVYRTGNLIAHRIEARRV